MIESLQLHENAITLRLPAGSFPEEEEEAGEEVGDDKEEDEELVDTLPMLTVKVDLALSAYANASAHHQSRKAREHKAVKTVAAESAASKALEAATLRQLAQVR